MDVGEWMLLNRSIKQLMKLSFKSIDFSRITVLVSEEDDVNTSSYELPHSEKMKSSLLFTT